MYIEPFNSKLREELLNREIFYTLKEARFLIEQWRRHYNGIRPYSALGYRLPPAVISNVGDAESLDDLDHLLALADQDVSFTQIATISSGRYRFFDMPVSSWNRSEKH